jgi:hypothetical protein
VCAIKIGAKNSVRSTAFIWPKVVTMFWKQATLETDSALSPLTQLKKCLDDQKSELPAQKG